jgi:hypothetical protein
MVSDDAIHFKRKTSGFWILNFRSLKLKIGKKLKVWRKTAVQTVRSSGTFKDNILILMVSNPLCWQKGALFHFRHSYSVFLALYLVFGSWSPFYRGFTITLRHTTLGRTPLDERSARRKDLYLTKHNTQNRHPCPRRDSNPQSHKASGRRRTP